MTIRDNSNNNKSFASAAPSTEEETYDPEAFNVNAADNVFKEDTILPFAHDSSVSTTAANSGYGQLNNNASATTTTNAGAQTTPIAYSTGKPPQPRSSSSSVAIATGAPMPTPTPVSTTQTSATTTTITSRPECCTGWTCCGITSVVLSIIAIIFICCILYFVIGIIIVVFTWDST